MYSLTPPAVSGGSWTFTNIYEFTGGNDGASPGAGVIIGPGSVLYGTTQYRGARIKRRHSFLAESSGQPRGCVDGGHSLYFYGPPDGGEPQATLAIDGDGILYGTTRYGGTAHLGVVFSLAPPAAAGGAWTETVLYSFAGGAYGVTPSGGVLPGTGGVLYGSTSGGGTANGGLVYLLTPTSGGFWTETVLRDFPKCHGQSCYPGPLAWGPNGVLYGVATRGGAQQDGSVFALQPPATPGLPWTFVPLYSFAPPGGNFPYFGETLAVSASGLIYGTTFQGGTGTEATVFSLHP